MLALLIILALIQLCRPSDVQGCPEHIIKIAKDFEFNYPAPIDIFATYEFNMVGDVFDTAVCIQSVELVTWLTASGSKNPEKLRNALKYMSKSPELFELALRTGQRELASLIIADPSRYDGRYAAQIVSSAIEHDAYAIVKGKFPIILYYSDQVYGLLKLALKTPNHFFDLMDDLNQICSVLNEPLDKEALDLVAKDYRVSRYLQMYPKLYKGDNYQKDVLEYCKEFKNDKKMMQAVWANLESVEAGLLDDPKLGIRVEDIVSSIPRLGKFWFILNKLNHPMLIDHALANGGDIQHKNISTCWKIFATGLWYALQNDRFKLPFIQHYSLENLSLKDLVEGLQLNIYYHDYKGITGTMQLNNRALIVAYPEIILCLRPEIGELIRVPNVYMLRCLNMAHFDEFNAHYVDAPQNQADYEHPVKKFFYFYKEEREKAAGNFELFCKAVLDGPAQINPWDRLALAGFGKLSPEDLKSLIAHSLEKGDFDIAYLGLQRLPDVKKIRRSDPEFYAVLLSNIAPSCQAYFKPYPQFMLKTFEIGPSELAWAIPPQDHYLVGKLFGEMDLVNLDVSDSEPFLVHVSMIMSADDEAKKDALGRILSFINFMNPVELLFALSKINQTTFFNTHIF